MTESKFFEVGDDVLEKVIKSFDKTRETFDDEVKELMNWLKTQHHLPELMSEKMLQNFYIANKCRVEKTKEKIENYYKMRSHYVCNNINPNKSPTVKRFMEVAYFLTFPKLTKEMYRVFCFKTIDKEKLDETVPDDCLRQIINIMELRFHEDVIFGDVLICDCKEMGLRYMLKITPAYLYRAIITIYKHVFSMRVKGIYVINTPSLMNIIVGIAKKIVPKLSERFHVSDDESCLEEIPKEILPKDFGGQEKSLAELNEMLRNKFKEYANRFDELDTLRIDESLRPPKLDTTKME